MSIHQINNKTNEKDLRKFAVTLFIALGIFGGFIFWKKGEYAFIPWGIGFILLIYGLLAPNKIRLVYKGWMALSLLLGFITSHIILAIMYYIVFTPIGFSLRIMGKDPLHKKIVLSEKSYWIKRDKKEYIKEQYEKMF